MPFSKYKIIFILIILVLFVFLIFKTKNSSINPTSSTKIQVITTLYPLYDFVKNIGQDKVDVSLLLPPGTEAHSFEPKPNDVIHINQSDIFIFTGKFMEPWVDDLISGLTNKNILIIDASTGIQLKPSVFHDADEPPGSMDPHIWMDLSNAQIMVDTITKALIDKDPLNQNFYKNNASLYKQKLITLDQKYQSSLSSCKSKDIIYGGHYAFGYLAARYGLKYFSAQGISPDSEPTVNDLADLVNQIKKDNIRYIFYEELSSPKIANTIANETGTGLLLLNAAHNISKDQFNNEVSFVSILETNLTNLKTGLQCQ